MNQTILRTPLMKWLRANDAELFGKTLEVETEVRRWLTYVPASFPHYTSHTIDHSEMIVTQLSEVLFGRTPKVKFSPIEIYILVVAAFLHDSGMVISDAERVALLDSSEWKSWIGGPGKSKWSAIRTVKMQKSEADKFAYNLQLRHLISEYFRAQHHVRSGSFIMLNSEAVGRADFGDPILGQTIADICIAHGLNRHELNDDEKFPERIAIRGQVVNKRFLAILLRLGDLLDLRSDRACSLLLSAACPLPSDSYAHWSKNRGIRNIYAGPDKIEITARCKSVEEHRLLKDWCNWIVDEVANAAVLMSHAQRHADWKVPTVSMSGPNPSIKITPDSSARYREVQWRFEVDHDIVLSRLIKDIYDRPDAFIRELLQNALDASRCQMYGEIAREGVVELPKYPNQAPANIRDKFPISISIRRVGKSGEDQFQLLEIEDQGLGMDSNIIERFLLQVGRSYYQTDDFRRSFAFSPTSRFGVGFLSAFGASEQIDVDTFKPTSAYKDGPLRLRLTGPRSYILAEKGERNCCGTKISLRLKNNFMPGQLTDAVKHYCVKVEFPIIVNDFGEITTIRAEPVGFFGQEIRHVSRANARFLVRGYPIQSEGVEGELYLVVYEEDGKEYFDRYNDAKYWYPKSHPAAKPIPFPDNLSCLHGMTVAASQHTSYRYRIDIRKPNAEVALSRSRMMWREECPAEVAGSLNKIVLQHLADSRFESHTAKWEYRHQLVSQYGDLDWWKNIDGLMPYYEKSLFKAASFREMLRVEKFSVLLDWNQYKDDLPRFADPQLRELIGEKKGRILRASHIQQMAENLRKILFEKMMPIKLEGSMSGWPIISWKNRSRRDIELSDDRKPMSIIEFDSPRVVGMSTFRTTGVYEYALINRIHPFGRWLQEIQIAAREGRNGITPLHFSQIRELVHDPITYDGFHCKQLNDYLAQWNRQSHLPRKFKFEKKLAREDFVRKLPATPKQ